MRPIHRQEKPVYTYNKRTKRYDSLEKTMRKRKAKKILLRGGIGFAVLAAILFFVFLLPYVENARRCPLDLATVPPYDGKPFAEINGNEPGFTKTDYSAVSYERYSALDSLGRCGPATACLSVDTMPDEERKSIRSVTPSGFRNEKYPFIEDEYLYNRCHLIAFMLSGENANERNLITGTHYLNTEGMLPFELRVARYIELTGNHVLYRVTPVFEGRNLVCTGVEIEALSVEDNGENICFHVFVYNVEPGVEIDYRTGASKEASD